MFTLEFLFDESVVSEFDLDAIDRLFMERHCTAALQRQSMLNLADVTRLELSASWLDEESMQTLNLHYRGRNTPTNVLSFESALPVLELPEGERMLVLGDLLLCPPIIEKEAARQNKPLRDHWAHMLVHGTLHLCGYDHQNDQQASDMESMEVNILAQSGMADPYQVMASP